MRERLQNWLLLRGNRYAVAGCALAVAAGILLPALVSVSIRNASPFYYVCSGLISGNITLVTVVVAINQVVLSRELEAPGELMDEIEQTADYRQTALDRSPAPAEATDFLRQLASQTHQDARLLAEAGDEATDHRVRESIDRLVPDLLAHCERVAERLDDGGRSLYSIIDPVIGAPYAEYVHLTRRIQAHGDDDGTERLSPVVDRLIDDLEELDVARQYFATMVIKEELANLSRSLIYLGVPAVAIPIALLFQLAAIRGAPDPSATLYALAAVTGLVGLSPLALLSAYVLRIATVARYIASITPFEAG